ncbi:MAG: DUF3800 domain-containing protein [Nitrososphaerales archaeon]
MFLSYVDSSGRPSFDDPENFVVASVITQETNWQTIDNAVKRIKLTHFPSLPDSEIEIHAKDMLNHNGLFKQMSWDQIYAVFEDVFSLISDPDMEICLIAVQIDKKKLHRSKDIETWAYRLLFERINRFVERRNAELIEANFAHEYGIMIFDTEGEKKDQRLRAKLFDMLRTGTNYSDLSCLIEDPMFTDSKWRNLSQLTDCVAYCVKKKFRANTPSIHTAHWDSYFEKIKSRFDCNDRGIYEGYGLKIFP